MPVLGSRNALLNLGRLNAFRLAFVEAALRAARGRVVRVTLDGAPLRVRLRSISIRDVINDAPNTCAFVVDDATPPTIGGRVRVALGVDPVYELFLGTMQAARQSYVGKSTAGIAEWACESIDDNQRAEWRLPFGAYEGVSASTVAADLVARFAPGYTSAHVQAGLPPVTVYFDGTEGMGGAFKQLAKLVGGYYYFENYDLHFFVGDEPGANPDDITGAPGQLLDAPAIAITRDDAQIRTRVYGKGHGENALTDVPAGGTTIPIASTVMFNAAGGRAISEWQRFTYGGTVLGGAGALVGPGVSPASAPLLASADGSGVTPGDHSYAYTWVKASPPGETLPSPLAAITVSGLVPAPPLDSVSSGVQTGGPPAGRAMLYALCIHNGSQASAASAALPLTSTGNRPVISFRTTADMRGRYLQVGRSDDGGATWAAAAPQATPPGFFDPLPVNYPIGATITFTDVMVNYTGGGPFPPIPATLAAARVQLSGIAVGPAAVTARNIYRTAAYGSQLRLLATVPDDVATTYLDALPDASLGANAPTADTSGLQMPSGTVPAGSTSMVVAATAWTVPGGGWAVIGNGQQVIKYTGATGNTITGIPASGAGAITAPVNYNSTISGAPLLYGVAGLGAALRAGAPVNLWVQADDADAQAELAGRTGTDGVVEHLISDERRGLPSLSALCAADLALYSRPIVTVRYTSFDPKSRSGRPVRVHLADPAIDATLMIQDVTIEGFGGGASVPRFAVTASSVRMSLEDLLRRMVGSLDEGF